MGRYKKQVQCSVCGKWVAPQGLKKHLEWGHDAPSMVSEKPKRKPSLVKPVEPVSVPDCPYSSPCHSATLRSAKVVLGTEDRALDLCYICAQCGEWYHLDTLADHPELAELAERHPERLEKPLKPGQVLFRLRHLPLGGQ